MADDQAAVPTETAQACAHCCAPVGFDNEKYLEQQSEAILQQ